MTRVFLALGSNIEPRLDYLQSAVAKLGNTGFVRKVAPLYGSKPFGYKEQADFYNSACILETDLSPTDLLRWVKEIEKESGRLERFRWGPREIDIDIIFYGDLIVREKELTIPHKDYLKRRFVLQPLVDLAEGFVPPGESTTLEQLLQNCPDKSELELIMSEWIDPWKLNSTI